MKRLRVLPLALALVMALGALQTVRAEAREGTWVRSRETHERWREFGKRAPGPEAPWITIILRNRDRLQLTADQVATLEKLRSDFTRDAIRKQADLRIAALDVRDLLRAEKVDLAQVKSKLEETAKIGADLRFFRIEILEKGKAVLTPEQREKLRMFYSSHWSSRWHREAGPRSKS